MFDHVLEGNNGAATSAERIISHDTISCVASDMKQ
jgi:hypothetical protein